MYQLLIGCWNVGIATQKEDMVDELELSGAGFNQTKWLEKSCIRHQRKVISLEGSVKKFWFNIDGWIVHDKI